MPTTPCSAAPVADELKRLPDLASFWLALARQIGLVAADSTGEKLLAAVPDFWTDNAVHLPQMIATGWMSLDSWRELDQPGAAGSATIAGLPYLRVALLLLLCTLNESEWVALDDLAEQLVGQSRPAGAAGVLPSAGAGPHNSAAPARGEERGKKRGNTPERETDVVEAILLGAAYPLGLVRAAEQDVTRKRLVQLSPLGRYVLALGPAPPPRPAFDQFLFVQPNFELIAYRQGLTPQLVGNSEPICLVVADRVGARAEADARIDRPGAWRGPVARSDPAMFDQAQPAGTAARRGRCREELGEPPRVVDPLHVGHARRIRLGARARPVPLNLAVG